MSPSARQSTSAYYPAGNPYTKQLNIRPPLKQLWVPRTHASQLNSRNQQDRFEIKYNESTFSSSASRSVAMTGGILGLWCTSASKAANFCWY